MEKPVETAIGKLVRAGEQAGLSVEQMIQLLQTGTSVETLLDWIACGQPTRAVPNASCWIM